MELREEPAGARQQLSADRTHESRMDEYLRSLGLYRKKIAKDGSCLFRAVAEQSISSGFQYQNRLRCAEGAGDAAVPAEMAWELYPYLFVPQVLQCQSLHTQVRATCEKYLRQNRAAYELFIEGDFEKYLENLQDPQSWVGQVEITALAQIYKHDFVIFQEPDQPPVNLTEHGFNKKVLLCFLNGNHYDSVYPESFEKNAALCQSVLYELLYDRVCGAERGALASCYKGGRGREKLDSDQCKSSEESDLEEEDFWSSEVGGKLGNGSYARPPPKGRGRGTPRGRGRGLSSKVQKSLNPAIYRNVEFDVWLRSKRLQQQRDFCMAAGMQYAVGDKCKVQLSGSNRLYNAMVQEVSPDNGPITVFIEELNRQQTVPLLNLRLPSKEPQPWQPTSEKGRQPPGTYNEREGGGGRRSNRTTQSGRALKQNSWPSADAPEDTRNNFRHSDYQSSPVCILPEEEEESVVLELLHKDEHNFPSLGTSSQMATTGDLLKKGGERRSFRKKENSSGAETPQRSGTEETHVIQFPHKPGQRTSPKVQEKLIPVSPPPPAAVPFSSASSMLSRSESANGSSYNQSASTTTRRTPVQLKSNIYQGVDNTESPLSFISSSLTGTVPNTTPTQSKPAPQASRASTQRAPFPTRVSTSEIVSQNDQARSPINPALVLAAPLTQPLHSGCIPNNTVAPLSLSTPVTSTSITSPSPVSALVPGPPSTLPLDVNPSGALRSISMRTPVADRESTSSDASFPLHRNHVSIPAQVAASVIEPPNECFGTIPLESSQLPNVGSPPAHVSTVLGPPNLSLSSLSLDERFGQAVCQQTASAAAGRASTTGTTDGGNVHPIAPQNLNAQDCSSCNIPIERNSGTPVGQKNFDPRIPHSHFQAVSDGQATGLPTDFPQDSLKAPPSCESFAAPASSVGTVPESTQTQQLPFPQLQWSQLLQDPLYPGFPQNKKGELEPLPTFSQSQKGEDLPQDVNVLKFFFNLGLKAYSQPLFPPVVYLAPLNQAYRIHHGDPTPTSNPSANPVDSWPQENPSVDDQAAVAPGLANPADVRMYDNSQSIPAMPPRPLVPTLGSPVQSGYSGAYAGLPPVQFAAPPSPPPGNHMHPQSSGGYQRVPFPSVSHYDHALLNHGPHARVDSFAFAPSPSERAPESGLLSVNPQFRPLQNAPGFLPLGGGEYKAPVEPANFGGPTSFVQPFHIVPRQGDTACLTSSVNARQGGTFSNNLHGRPIGEDPSQLIHAYPTEDGWMGEMGSSSEDLRVAQSLYYQSNRGGARQTQDDKGRFRGRGPRGRRDYPNRSKDQSYMFCGGQGAALRFETPIPYQ
ncbi:hypothetical protein DNTS_005271 [Danionella cerebrum]|uniref:ubiquitinyl hydrolase 1 n=1 Tax=Danionella cerebrum TaxID=2873325 RepID=A0A553R8Q5_9TELE|nr:hypothetical protein DNTS_005271 [Danionella translucida]